jgi:hypothetical protein
MPSVHVSPQRRLGLSLLAWVVAVAGAPGTASAEPRITLKLPAFPGATFPDFAAVTVPETYGALEIWLEDALDEVQISTVKVRLNDLPMTPFVVVNPLPRGVRVIMRGGITTSSEYRLRLTGENLLSFLATDSSKVSYEGRFYLTVDSTVAAPRPTPMKSRPPTAEVSAPSLKLPPEVRFTSDWPERTNEQVLTLAAQATDPQGLVRVVLEVNGKDIEEITFQNELPLRKDAGFATSRKLPGDVSGDSRSLSVARPVRLDKDITVVAVRAENSLGLRTRIDRTVERIRNR